MGNICWGEGDKGTYPFTEIPAGTGPTPERAFIKLRAPSPWHLKTGEISNPTPLLDDPQPANHTPAHRLVKRTFPPTLHPKHLDPVSGCGEFIPFGAQSK